MDIFPLVYRCVVIIKPKQPLLDWLRSVDSSHHPTLEEISEDSHAYLVPDFEETPDIEKAIDKYLKNNFEGIFLNELIAWYTDPQMFPKMTYSLFQAWFDISIHTMLFDTVSKPITKE